MIKSTFSKIFLLDNDLTASRFHPEQVITEENGAFDPDELTLLMNGTMAEEEGHVPCYYWLYFCDIG